MSDEEIIELGTELGSLTLWGRRTTTGSWEFRTSSVDWSSTLLDEEEGGGSEPTCRESAWVDSWAAAVALLDERRWARLVPIQIHPEFRDDALAEAARRLLAEPGEQARKNLERWASVCMGK